MAECGDSIFSFCKSVAAVFFGGKINPRRNPPFSQSYSIVGMQAHFFRRTLRFHNNRNFRVQRNKPLHPTHSQLRTKYHPPTSPFLPPQFFVHKKHLSPKAASCSNFFKYLQNFKDFSFDSRSFSTEVC